jgi:hypothetical protein
MCITSTAKINAGYKFSIFNLQPSAHSFLEKNEFEKRTTVRRPLPSFLEKKENQSFLLKILCKPVTCNHLPIRSWKKIQKNLFLLKILCKPPAIHPHLQPSNLQLIA